MSRRSATVAWMWMTVSLASVVTAGAGCVEIDGGAVEVPWAIFAPDGRAITDCSCAVTAPDATPANTPIAFVQLDLMWAPSNPSPCTDPTTCAPCAGRSSCRFPCGRKIGATPFMIPTGQYLMSLAPLGADGTELAIESTAPVLRPVERGRPTELEAVAFTASCATRCNGGVSNQPCAGS